MPPNTATRRPEEVLVAPKIEFGQWRDPAPPLLFDIAGIDLEQIAVPLEGIQRFNKHRGEAQQVDHITWVGEGYKQAIGSRTVRDDEWWCDGHIPGAPIMPAVMMIEAAAQINSWMFLAKMGPNHEYVGFVGFVRIENTKFRSKVHPGDRLYILCQEIKFHPRRFVVDNMGIKANGDIAFESKITGMVIG